MNILVFTEGTLLMHHTGKGKTREERVQQVLNKDTAVKEYGHYVPIGKAPAKVQEWIQQGHQVEYLTSRKRRGEVEQIRNVLQRYFPQGKLYYRQGNESYKDVLTRAKPDTLIEDNCESIGGEAETCASQCKGMKIQFIVVPEFGGIDYLTLP